MRKKIAKKMQGSQLTGTLNKQPLSIEQQIDQPTWSLRRPENPEIRRLVADIMRVKNLNRSQAVVYLLSFSMGSVVAAMTKALNEEKQKLEERASQLAKLTDKYGLKDRQR